MAKRNKYKEPVKLDEDLTFEQAMARISKANKKDVEKAIKADKEDKKAEPEEGGEDQ